MDLQIGRRGPDSYLSRPFLLCMDVYVTVWHVARTIMGRPCHRSLPTEWHPPGSLHYAAAVNAY